jgi:hypothetical protein
MELSSYLPVVPTSQIQDPAVQKGPSGSQTCPELCHLREAVPLWLCLAGALPMLHVLVQSDLPLWLLILGAVRVQEDGGPYIV